MTRSTQARRLSLAPRPCILHAVLHAPLHAPLHALLHALLHAIGSSSRVTAAKQMGSLICKGATIIMLAKNAKNIFKWEVAVVSNMDYDGMIWARIKARGNREYAVVKTDETEQCYGTKFYKIKKAPMP